jgi:hypothetical protein
MGATKARSNNRPILDPPKTVLNPHSDLAQLSVEGLVFLGQFFPPRFLKRSLDGQARHELFRPSLRVGHCHLADLLS